MTFLKTILILLLIYFGLKFTIRLLLPYLMRYVARKASEKMGRAFQGGASAYSTAEKPKKEGKVTIDKVPRKEKAPKKPVGDYVDYEEID